MVAAAMWPFDNELLSGWLAMTRYLLLWQKQTSLPSSCVFVSALHSLCILSCDGAKPIPKQVSDPKQEFRKVSEEWPNLGMFRIGLDSFGAWPDHIIEHCNF